ncbi:N-6 DNA methylase [Fodinibacter luteus]|uniref:site-specific DNA-methyltransferase (adenine-specific) n=1 Tax=Fodinibacter luteus TaxID=552064 RepID=A0ABP8K7K8_9MICO
MASDFTTVRTVGGLIPPDLLSRVISGDHQLSGLSSSDYHLAGESPREAANRAWSYLTGVWVAYREALHRLPDGDPAVGLTREKWLLQLLREFGYGRVTTTPAGGLTIADRSFPVSHLWGSTPIHLLGWGVDLDKRTKGVPGAADRAPHAMVQEALNRTDDYLYAFLSNGRVLRLLRDSTSLSGQSYLEFDLEAMFEGEVFSDFVLLFLLLHQSRVEIRAADGAASDCWLETWRTTTIAAGTRALTLLRGGVQAAIEALGTGFLQHPASVELRRRIDEREARVEDLHHALLRLVYRLLFLFVAEDRGALLSVEASTEARKRYVDFFSTARLRRLALRRRGTKHTDLWAALTLVITALGDEKGQPALGLPGIGGLYDPHEADALLMDAQLPNDALLAAVRSLSVVQPKGQPKQSVDYRNLGAEELGSIYESLLELVPRHNSAEQAFTLETLAGNDRKTTGSYYTPSSLIDLVLDEALDPLLDEAERAAEPESALLAMTVCDPACGSGHFLVAAARRIAERLATVRTGETDLTPSDVQDALHDVVGRCIYGVDLNPMAAELAKVSLWLEAMTPGRPLSFLDSHIKVGNALLGTTPALLAQGIPDDAFVALTGDDKRVVTTLKKQNKRERDEGQDSLFDATEAAVSNADLRSALSDAVPKKVRSLVDIHEASRRYAAYLFSPELARERLRADAWCGAFVQPKTDVDVPITTSTIRAIEEGTVDERHSSAVQARAAEYRFFHWWLEFPEVFEVSAATATEPNGSRGGFTAMVGNPPWERIKLQEQEFFAQRDATVASAANAVARKRLIKTLSETNPILSAEWEAASRQAEAMTHLIRKSGRYPLCGVGDINTYSIFAELFRSSIARNGRLGIITPTGLATDATTSAFFADTVKHQRLAAFYDFENEAKIFQGVHNQFRFALTAITGGTPVHDVHLAFYTRYVADTIARRYALSPEEVLMLNPNTGTLPVFRTRRDAEITLGIYRRFPVLVNDADNTNPWGLRFASLFHMANDSGLFETEESLSDYGAEFDGWAWSKGPKKWLPLYEAKMLSHWDHRYSTYEGATQAQLNKGTLPRLTDSQHDDPTKEPLARYWVAEPDVAEAIGDRWDRGWFLGWRDITNASNERTFILSAIPRSAVGARFNLILPGDKSNAPNLQAALSSYISDFIARQKMSGAALTQFIIKQLACPAPEDFTVPLPGVSDSSLACWIRSRLPELTYTSRRIAAYARDCTGAEPASDLGPPFRWIPERREALRAELDAAMFHLYGLARDEVAHVMDSFFVVRKYDERDHGEFRTKRLILEIYDAMAEAAAGGGVYESLLDPPAGEGPRHAAREE